ncbi:hypothetical protein BB560_000047 [Smittium megazygosporum]|uniref:GATA-type domain-containing protein n=1 Tax=Smittium megazygosporum TaxID=133381 RepID=A0A2T9ZLJ6_9FUNG|nr:hypothetical protein BB560_000047 [Smittium megazygosporum]
MVVQTQELNENESLKIPFNIPFSKNEQIICDNSDFIMSQLSCKLKHIQDIFDSFLNTVSPSTYTNNTISDPSLNLSLYDSSFAPSPDPESVKIIVNDVFLTPPQDYNEFCISNSNLSQQVPTFNLSIPSTSNTEDNFQFDFDLPDSKEIEDTSESPQSPGYLNDTLENKFSSILISNSSLSEEKDDETTSQTTACNDSDWSDYEISETKYYLESSSTPKAQDLDSSSSTPNLFSDEIVEIETPNDSIPDLSISNKSLEQRLPSFYSDESSPPSSPEATVCENDTKLLKPTVFEYFTNSGVDWCRYCGTTEGINWRPGPWGKRTLCNKHGCDYKGYGFASRAPRLDLRSFLKESVHDRKIPVLQKYKYSSTDPIYYCSGCPNSYHKNCLQTLDLDDAIYKPDFFCHSSCLQSFKKNRIESSPLCAPNRLTSVILSKNLRPLLLRNQMSRIEKDTFHLGEKTKLKKRNLRGHNH